MNRRIVGAAAGTTAMAVTMVFSAGAVAAPKAAAPHQAAPAVSDPDGVSQRSDVLPNPKAEAQAKLRRDAVDQVVKGTATVKTVGGKKVIEVQAPEAATNAKSAQTGKATSQGSKGSKGKKGKYVEYDPNRTTKIFTTLAAFGEQTKPATGGTVGPKQNQIPEPDRSVNNSTYWVKDFSRQHYLTMFNAPNKESFTNFYKAQSQGRFQVTSDVTDWVTVPYNEARYGHNPVAGDGTSESEGYWAFVGDSLTAWYNQQKALGRSNAEITTYLKQFDTWDRYDFDGDGNFNEPDGYIDHYQAIHAGEGEEAGGGAQGDDAIWSHRWAVQSGAGKTGPGSNKSGGVQIGNTGIWVQDYTTEPENGGLGVFAHEFGHDLGLPDLYDTAGGDNSTGYWSLMSSGSWLNHGQNAIGDVPGYMGAWEKLQLGWSDTQSVKFGANTTIALGPADQDNKNKPTAVAVNLPDKVLTTQYVKPWSGSYEWWSGRGDDLSNSLTRDVDLTAATTASLSAAVSYDIEEGYDYLYPQVSTNGGTSWTEVGTPISGTKSGWSTVNYDLSAYKGQKIKFRFLYVTDGGVNQAGAFLDDLALTVGDTTVTDNVESGTSVWTPAGFTRMNGTTTESVTRYYLAEYRRYNGYDKTLKQGPYNFGFADKADWVEHYPYQDGLLVTYANNEFVDNNTSVHPGGGQVLRSMPIRCR